MMLVVLVSLWAVPFSAQSKSIQGVWRVTRVTTTGPNGRTISNPQPGLYIFTAKHYAMMTAEGDQSRYEIPPGQADRMTTDQLRAAWEPFAANAGTYDLAGDTLTTKAIVAKNQAVMKNGNFQTYSVKMEGKTLTVTAKATDLGPAQNPTSYKLTRVE
jgi:hypothetical protein